ncbi:MAG: bifunctional glycosyltransferase family 2/GtrA family protein [Chitinispirillales bacterium]|jgi:glycosyltransferase involved in cell wall biosynthesis|nr:bifunctional glycosyltransferase family 2/GtrA family protein [Chitinispirillales bacterium]
MNFTLSLIVPCYNEAQTIEICVKKLLDFSKGQDFSLEIITVDDASTDGSLQILERIAERHSEIKVLKHEKNRGKGAALRTGFIHASGDFVGIQDADDEYDPNDYSLMLEPMTNGKADVVYGSRYLLPDTRRVLYFWHTWMNKALTKVSNMFTNLDITDMETCYKLFRRDIIQKIAPQLKEERFGFEPEITALAANAGCRVYECAISYNPRTYEEGKKIGWKDGMRALYCIFHYSAHRAPLPMQILIYLFIGTVSMLANMAFFISGNLAGLPLNYSITAAFILAATVNYILCVLILFKHNARWKTPGELLLYGITITFMGSLDFGLTRLLMTLSGGLVLPKFIAATAGFAGNFLLRKWLVFPEKNRTKNLELRTQKNQNS